MSNKNMTQKWIRGKEKIYVGLEDSLKSWVISVRCKGREVQTIKIPAKYDVLKGYFENQFPECSITVIYEAGFQGFWLHDMLVEDGISCIVTPPNKVTQAKDTRVKTDKHDAIRLAKMLEMGDYVACHVPDKERMMDREVSRTYEQTTQDIVRVKNQIRGKLRLYGLEVGQPHGRWYDKDYLALRDIAFPSQLQICFDMLLNKLELLLSNRAMLKAKLKKISEKDRYQRSIEIKMSIPGIGLLTATRLTLEWGDMSRFKNGKKLSSYAGLVPCEYSTGETVHRGHITGQSNQQIRKWLIECAWRAIKKDGVLLMKYNDVCKNGNNKKKAIVAVARKLVVRMHALEKNDDLYVCGVVE